MSNGIVQDRFRTKVSLVLVLIDDFTNKTILDSGILIRIKNHKPPIRKTDGYYVFVNLEPNTYDVKLESELFHTNTVQIEVKAEQAFSFVKVRMIPNRTYPIPRDTTCIEGICEPNSIVRIFCKEMSKPYKLLYDYSKDKKMEHRHISLFHPEDVDIEGKVLFIEDKEGKNQEYFSVMGIYDAENKRYLLREELKNNYKKIGTSLYPVSIAEADAEGNFFLPIANIGKEKNIFYCEASGSKTISCNKELIAGRVNKINLTGEK